MRPRLVVRPRVLSAIFLGFSVSTAAWAEPDPNPRIEWSPILIQRTAIETTRADITGESVQSGVDLAARLGLSAHREALTARLSLGVAGGWSLPRNSEEEQVVGAEVTMPWLYEASTRISPEVSEALQLDVTIGRQPVQFHEGRIVGADDRRLRGDTLDVARVRLAAAPWSLDLVGGVDVDVFGDDLEEVEALDNAGALSLSGFAPVPILFARVGAGRENAVSSWEVDAIYTGGRDESGDDVQTLGAYARVDAGRVRARVDGYLQPHPLASGLLAGAKLGWAFGDDARVAVGTFGEYQSGDHGGTLAFDRPWATTGEDFGYFDLQAPDGEFAGAGALSTGAWIDARVTPGVRLEGRAHLVRTLDDGLAGPEIDGDIHWWLTPLSALRLRGGVLVPFDDPAAVRTVSALSLDVAI